MNELIKFDFENQEVRFVGTIDNPSWIALDICRILEIRNSRDALSRLDDDEKGVVIADTLGGKQEMVTVNESGLYSLILRSRKPQAKRLRKWVTSVVLPSIRKTGKYSIARSSSPESSITPQSLIDLYSKILPTSLSEELKATYLLRAIEAQFPEISPSVQRILPGVQSKSDEEYVSPTKLAQTWNSRHGTNIKAYQINNALEKVGLQVSHYSERISTKTGKLKRTKSYSPTEKGNNYGTFILDKAGSDKTVQHLRWKVSVLEEIAEYFNGEVDR